MDECCVALAFTQAPRADRACPSVWPAQLIHELVEDFAGAAIEEEIVIDSRRGSGRDSEGMSQLLYIWWDKKTIQDKMDFCIW